MEGGTSPIEPPHMERIPIQQPSIQPMPAQSSPKPGNRAVIAMLITGSILMFVGTVLLDGRYLLSVPSGSHTDYDMLTGRLTFAGNTLIAVGVLLVALVGWFVGITRSDLPEGVRRNAVIAAALVVAAWFMFSLITVTRFYVYP